jgi:hypothetical protein
LVGYSHQAHRMLIAKYTLARIIITYYWAFVLGSLALFSIDVAWDQKPRSVIEFSFYAVYLIIFALMKDLLLNKIPDTFLVLRHNGALKEGALERLMHTWVNRLGALVGNFLGLVLTFAIFWFYNLDTWGEWQRIYRMDFWSAALKMGPEIIDLLLAYAGGVALWILMVTAWKFYYLGRIGELNIRPFHPDRCAGLGSIGQLLFFSSLILVVIALFSGGWLLSGKGNPDIDPAFRAFQQWLAGTLLWVGVVSICRFLRTAH